MVREQAQDTVEAPAGPGSSPGTGEADLEQPPPPESGDGASTRGQRPTSEAFRRFIASGWHRRGDDPVQPAPAAPHAARRRDLVSRAFPGERVIVPAGGYRVRSNDTDHRFRPHTAFAWLTGLGTDREPDAVLVLEPGTGEAAGTHEARLYFRPRAPRDSEEFYADTRYGELWVGERPSLVEVSELTGIRAVHLDSLIEDVTAGLGELGVRLVRDASPELTASLDAARTEKGVDLGPLEPVTVEDGEDPPTGAAVADRELARTLSTMRLVKDEWEIAQMREAVRVTADAFDDVVAALPRTAGHPRGERLVESAFTARSREWGNGLGYDVIAAAGAHACTLHWIRNDGAVDPADLILVDAGIELDSLYTADVTRTLPVSGTFSPAQRQVYETVLAAADAAFGAARPGASLKQVHEAAMAVLAEALHDWGLLPVPVATSLDKDEGGHHRRWCVHGTSHHLGMDVHDCALARREDYTDGELRPGMIFTIEPGLYFRPDDELVPARLRGIGVRIEDDVLVTADGVENLSAMLPREPDAVQRWVRTGHR